MVVGENPIDYQFLKYSVQPVWPVAWYHSALDISFSIPLWAFFFLHKCITDLSLLCLIGNVPVFSLPGLSLFWSLWVPAGHRRWKEKDSIVICVLLNPGSALEDKHWVLFMLLRSAVCVWMLPSEKQNTLSKDTEHNFTKTYNWTQTFFKKKKGFSISEKCQGKLSVKEHKRFIFNFSVLGMQISECPLILFYCAITKSKSFKQ